MNAKTRKVKVKYPNPYFMNTNPLMRIKDGDEIILYCGLVI